MTETDKPNISEISELNFETAIKKLEKIVEELESGGLNLDRSLEKFSKGVSLIKHCNQELDQAEKKIEKVLKNDEEYGDIVPFEFKEE